MSYALRIRHLEEIHNKLKTQVTDMQKHTFWTDHQLSHLKKEKLRIKDEIYRLQRLEQQEEDRDYVRAEEDDY